MSIMIVDDSLDSRLLIEKHLTDQGYVCHIATSGDGALEVLVGEDVSLALVDIMMPGMTGLTLFQRMKEGYPDVAVIFVSSVDDLNLAVDYLKGGAYDYIVKPVTRKRLLEVVEEALARREEVIERTQHQKLLEDQTTRQATELEARMRELAALNRVFQADLSARFSGREGPRTVKLDSLGGSRIGQGKMHGRESEKRRISEYLHGHVQSRLLVLQHRLSQCQEMLSLEPQKASNLLGEIKTDLRSVQEEDIRRASHELYPSIVKIGLVAALRSLVDRFQHALQVDLYVEAGIQRTEEDDWRAFPEEFRVGVYRIVEEALDNVVKHAHARVANVAAYQPTHGDVSLEITDDGRGFDTTEVSSALGLLSMRDCAEALGGTCQVESAPGQGSRILVVLPVPANCEGREGSTPGHVMA